MFPDLFKDVKEELDKDTINAATKDMQDFMDLNKAPGLPGWFRM